MGRRTVLAAVVMAVVLGLLATAVVLQRRGDAPSPRPAVPIDIPGAEQLARQACADARTFEEEVRNNAPSRNVLDTLDRMRSAANEAADRDPRWRSLASGTDALRLAIREDEAAAARVGIDVVRAQCADLA